MGRVRRGSGRRHRGLPRLPLARRRPVGCGAREPVPAQAAVDQQLRRTVHRPRPRRRGLHRQLRAVRRARDGDHRADTRRRRDVRACNVARARADCRRLPRHAPRLDRGGSPRLADPRRRRALAQAVILGLETSCDETAAALVTHDGAILTNVVSSQAELHARYGGVVPEVASRRHLELVTPVIREALAEAKAELDDVELVAVTTGPGLIGALLVGVAAAKAIAWARRPPLAAGHHPHGHVASLYPPTAGLEPPFLCLLASGGPTLLLAAPEPRHNPPVLPTTIHAAAGPAVAQGAAPPRLRHPRRGRRAPR